VSLDPAAVAEAVDEVGRIIRADGGDLRLVDADPATLRISLALDLSGVSCEDCVLPPDQLRDTIARNPNVSEFRRMCIERGMVTLRADGMRKVAKGITTVQEVLRVTEATH